MLPHPRPPASHPHGSPSGAGWSFKPLRAQSAGTSWQPSGLSRLAGGELPHTGLVYGRSVTGRASRAPARRGVLVRVPHPYAGSSLPHKHCCFCIQSLPPFLSVGTPDGAPRFLTGTLPRSIGLQGAPLPKSMSRFCLPPSVVSPLGDSNRRLIQISRLLSP